jgi:EmrB/QacA subfamily drug resistance transporter
MILTMTPPGVLATKEPTESPPRAKWVLGILSLAAFMASLDLFIVNVAFTAIGHDFRGALTNLSWILNGYAIIYAALLIPLGRLADRYGRKAGFLLGLAVFTGASAACAASPSLWPLVGFRILQAAGAAALTPTSLGLLLAATPPAGRARAVRVWAATGAIAAAVGPALGGVLVSGSWRLIFLVNVPVGVLALVATAKLVPDSRDPAVNPRIPDVAGSVLLAVAIGALALGLVKGSGWGWGNGRTVASFAICAAGMVAFAWRSGHHPSPVIEPALLRVRAFAWSNVTAVAFTVGFAANLLLSILWMQDVWHYSAIETGLAVAPGPMMVPLFSIVAGVVIRRFGVGAATAIGCVVFAAGVLLTQVLVGAHPAYLTELLPGQLITGAGVGFALPTILSSATADLPPYRAATGSAVVNMSRQVGSVLGVSVLIALLGVPHGYHAAYHAFEHGRLVCAATALLAAAAAFGMTPSRAKAGAAPL